MEPKKQIDARDIAKFLSGTGLLAVIGIAAFIYLLPVITSIVWQGVTLLVGLGTLGILGLVLTNKRFWRNMKAINEKIAKVFTFWLITWDEFLLQEMEIEEAKKGRDNIKKQASILEGQVASKDDELLDAKNKMEDSKLLVQQLLKEGKTNDDPEVMLYSNDYVRQQDFITSISPLRDQIDHLAKLCMKVYKQSDLQIKDATAELKVQKAKFESLTAGESAMTSALNIFKADSPDVLLAKEVVKKKIGEKIGSIKTTLEIINPIMDERSLKDKIKVQKAIEQMKTLDITQLNQIPQQQSSYNNLLK